GPLRHLFPALYLIHSRQRARVGTERVGADLAWRVGGKQSHCLLEDRQAFFVSSKVDEQVRPANQQRNAVFGLSLVADLGVRLVDQRKPTVGRPRERRSRRGRVEQLRVLDAGALLGIGYLKPQLESELVMPLGRRGRERGRGGTAGPHRRGKRTREVVRG